MHFVGCETTSDSYCIHAFHVEHQRLVQTLSLFHTHNTDVKTSLMELHDLGPVKLFDTAGIDESGQLGEKKRKKSLAALKESDIGVLVVDVSRHQRLLENGQLDTLRVSVIDIF